MKDTFETFPNPKDYQNPTDYASACSKWKKRIVNELREELKRYHSAGWGYHVIKKILGVKQK